MKKKDIIKEIKETNIYDFVCRHSYEMSRDELADIIREMDYAIYSKTKRVICITYEEFAEEFIDNLTERWEDEIAEEEEEEDD